MPGIPTLTRWKERTAVTASTRGATLNTVDAAIDEYNKSKSDDTVRAIYNTLRKWMSESGPDWEKSPRNANKEISSVYDEVYGTLFGGLKKVTFSATELAGVKQWEQERAKSVQRFFSRCQLVTKDEAKRVYGLSVTEVGLSVVNAIDVRSGWSTMETLVRGIVKNTVQDNTVQNEVIQFLFQSGIFTRTLANIATSIIPFKGLITSGASALYSSIRLAYTAYVAKSARSHRFVLDAGTPQAAFEAMMIVIDRAQTEHARDAAQSGAEFGARAVCTALDITQTSQVAISFATAVASLTRRIFLIGRDFTEQHIANLAMTIPERITLQVMTTHPILGCYYLVAAEKSDLLAFFGDFGKTGWMNDVEYAIKHHLTPLQETAGSYIDDCRFELLRGNGRICPAPGAWSKLKKWKNGAWEFDKSPEAFKKLHGRERPADWAQRIVGQGPKA